MAVFSRERPKRRIANPNSAQFSKSNAITAAGFKVTRRDADALRRLVAPWQARSFGYYDTLGEIKFAAQFYSRMLSPLRLYAAELNEKGEIVETTNEDAKRALELIQDPGGGRTGLLSQYGRLMFLVGEAYLLCTKDTETGDMQWEMLSTDELRIQSGIYMRYKAPSLQADEYREPSDEDFEPLDENTAVAYRLWRKHPRYSMLADSTMQGVLDLCEELMLLTLAVRSRCRSRLAGNGVLFIDERISQAPDEPEPGEDPKEDLFLEDFIEGITRPISDEGAASAVAPILVRVPQMTDSPGVKVSDLVYHLQVVDPMQLYPETGLRSECIHRIAIGLDMPAEVLEGLEDSNHWTAWLVDEQTWKGHGQPIAQSLVEDLTQAYYRPQLRAWNVPNAGKYLIAYDASAIINHPNRTTDAKDLYGLGVLSDEALRDAGGFNEDDKPSETEKWMWLGSKIRDGSLALYGEPSVKSGGVETQAGEILSPSGAVQASDVVHGPPQQPTDAPAEQPLSGTVVGGGANGHANGHEQSWVVLGAAQFGLLRAREIAGNRILSRAKRDRDVHDELRGAQVKARDVAAYLGMERVHALGLNERELVQGARDSIIDALKVQGVKDRDTQNTIADAIERTAARTLYDTDRLALPSSFQNYLLALKV